MEAPSSLFPASRALSGAPPPHRGARYGHVDPSQLVLVVLHAAKWEESSDAFGLSFGQNIPDVIKGEIVLPPDHIVSGLSHLIHLHCKGF